jgi:hypothetical protein
MKYNGAQDLNFTNIQNTLGIAMVVLSGELWSYVKNREVSKKLTSFRLSSPSAAKKGVDEVMRSQEDDKVVYMGEANAKPRRKASAIAVPELKRYTSDATIAYQKTFEKTRDTEDEPLTADERLLDTAYKKAIHLMSWWNETDKDRDRCIDEKELRTSFPSKDMAKELIAMLDIDGDRLITFTEMSWAVCKTLAI